MGLESLRSELFFPDSEMLKIINFQGGVFTKNLPGGHYLYHIFTPETFEPALVSGVLGNIAEFYRKSFDFYKGDFEKFDPENIIDIVSHAVENSIVHGEGICLYGLFLGGSGMWHGFKDFGDYFHRQCVKDSWEKKEKIFSSGSKEVGGFKSGAGLGVNDFIFPSSDEIRVDIDNGVLYCLQLKERFVFD